MKEKTNKVKKPKKPRKSFTKGTYKEYKYMTMQETWHKIKETPEIKGKINYAEYKKIMRDLTLLVLEEVLINPQGFQLPNRLGVLQMIGLAVPQNNTPIGMDVLAITDGYSYKIRHLTTRYIKVQYQEYYFYYLSDLATKLIKRRVRKDDFFHLLKFRSAIDMHKATDKDDPETRIKLRLRKGPRLDKESYREMMQMVKDKYKNKDNQNDNKG